MVDSGILRFDKANIKDLFLLGKSNVGLVKLLIFNKI
jgi:hypothetical protein